MQEGIDVFSGVTRAEEGLDVEAFPPAVKDTGTELFGLLSAAVAERHIVPQSGASPVPVVFLVTHHVWASARGVGRLREGGEQTARGQL